MKLLTLIVIVLFVGEIVGKTNDETSADYGQNESTVSNTKKEENPTSTEASTERNNHETIISDKEKNDTSTEQPFTLDNWENISSAVVTTYEQSITPQVENESSIESTQKSSTLSIKITTPKEEKSTTTTITTTSTTSTSYTTMTTTTSTLTPTLSEEGKDNETMTMMTTTTTTTTSTSSTTTSTSTSSTTTPTSTSSTMTTSTSTSSTTTPTSTSSTTTSTSTPSTLPTSKAKATTTTKRSDKPSTTVNNHTTAVKTFHKPCISLTGNEFHVQLIIFSLQPIVTVFFYLNYSKDNVNSIPIQRRYQVDEKLLATGSLLKNIWRQADPQPAILPVDGVECYVLKVDFTQNLLFNVTESFYNYTDDQVQNDQIKHVTEILVDNDALIAAFVNESKNTRTELVTQGEMAPNLPIENVMKTFEESNLDFKYSLMPAKWIGETVTFERNFEMSVCVWDIVALKNENFTISLSRLPFNTPVDKDLAFVFEFLLDHEKIHFYEKSNGFKIPFDVVSVKGLREKKTACFRLRYLAETHAWSWDIGQHSTIAYAIYMHPKPYHISFRGKFDGAAMTKVALKYTANKVTGNSPDEPIFTKPDPLDEVFRKEFDDFTKNANIIV